MANEPALAVHGRTTRESRHAGWVELVEQWRATHQPRQRVNKPRGVPVIERGPPPLPLAPETDWPDLYFIGSDNGPIKIGISISPYKRLKQLQTSHPYRLKILAIVAGGCQQEPEYHERFAAFRLEGEWFEPRPELLAEIERLK